jgi:hypothetical protein
LINIIKNIGHPMVDIPMKPIKSLKSTLVLSDLKIHTHKKVIRDIKNPIPQIIRNIFIFDQAFL